MEFCYEMPAWMSLGLIFFLARFAGCSVFQKGIQTNLSSSEYKVIP